MSDYSSNQSKAPFESVNLIQFTIVHYIYLDQEINMDDAYKIKDELKIYLENLFNQSDIITSAIHLRELHRKLETDRSIQDTQVEKLIQFDKDILKYPLDLPYVYSLEITDKQTYTWFVTGDINDNSDVDPDDMVVAPFLNFNYGHVRFYFYDGLNNFAPNPQEKKTLRVVVGDQMYSINFTYANEAVIGICVIPLENNLRVFLCNIVI